MPRSLVLILAALCALCAGCSNGTLSSGDPQDGTLSAMHAIPIGTSSPTPTPSASSQLPGCASGAGAKCHGKQDKAIPPVANSASLLPAQIPGYHPADLQSAYNLPSASAGAHRSVAIVIPYDDPNAESDLAVYRSKFGLPACSKATGCFQKIGPNGTSKLPAANVNWAPESSIDVDMVSAACPNCSIVVVEANSDQPSDLATALLHAVALKPTVVSNSWSLTESQLMSLYQAYDSVFQHPGIPVVAGSGDAGQSVSWPAADASVIAVGGTSLMRGTSANGRAWIEKAWSSAGFGCSAYVAKPSWQALSPCSTRGTADISAVADPSTGVSVYDTYSGAGGWAVYGGTSVAAPIVAGGIALANDPSKITPALLYQHAAALNNLGPAYNPQTGLGSPNNTNGF